MVGVVAAAVLLLVSMKLCNNFACFLIRFAPAGGGAESSVAMPAQESDVKVCFLNANVRCVNCLVVQLKDLCNPVDPTQIYEQMTKIGEG